ncbi:MAG TPA: hypothetical protein VL401_01870 [Alphaproteobacteria bacterium]|jgi:septation ring formation regulator EzrA|nr:hypothetical protein [Alphaproteobacteria bacterium]
MNKVNPSDFVTNQTLNEAVDQIVEGMDNMLGEIKELFKSERKYNTETFSTKEDIQDLRADIVGRASKTEFKKLKTKVDNYLPL